MARACVHAQITCSIDSLCSNGCGTGAMPTTCHLIQANMCVLCKMHRAAGVSFDDCQATFKTALLNLCSHKPGLDSGQFSPDSIAQIGNFFAKTFFRHFKLYAYVFSNEQAHTEYTTGLLVSVAACRRAWMHEAVTLAVKSWRAYLAAHALACAACQAQCALPYLQGVCGHNAFSADACMRQL